MNRQEIIATVIATSQLYNEIALSISQKLLIDLQENRIDFDHFLSVQINLVRPLIVQSTKMVLDKSTTIIDGTEQHFQSILEGSNSLKREINTISKVEKIIKAAATVLSTAALIATFVAAPNPASALSAISSLTGLIGALKVDGK